MGKKRVDPERKREAIVQVVGKRKTLRQAARDLGVTPSTLHEAVKRTEERTAAEIIKQEPAAPESSSGPAAEPSHGAAPAPSKSTVDKILEKVGIKPAATKGDPTAPIKPGETTEIIGRVDAAKVEYCAKKVQAFKGIAVFGLSKKYKIPLHDEAAKTQCQRMAQVSEPLDVEVRANAEFLYPYLVKFGGPGMLLLTAVWEFYSLMGEMKSYAVKVHGFRPPVREDNKETTKRDQVREAQEADVKRKAAEAAPAAATTSSAAAPDPFNCPNPVKK